MTKSKPVQMSTPSFGEMIKEAILKQEEAIKKFKENGGMCLNCEKELGDLTSTLNPMNCKKCNAEIEELLKQLRGPGFIELKIGVK